jgi:lipopolysaccharide/colanic/teichoic acid biosynthesis glycosyltransferase
MKVLFVSQYFPPEPGAPSARVYEHAKYWVRAGHDVTVLTGFPHYPTGRVPDSYRGKLYQWEKNDGIRVLRTWLYATPNKGFLNRIWSYISFGMTAVLLGSVKTGRFDLVIGTSPQMLGAAAAYLISFFKHRPFILEVRDLWPAILVELGIFKNRMVISVLESLEGFLYRRASKIIVVTEAFKTAISRRGIPPAKIELIPNGVDLDLFNPDHLGEGIRSRLGLIGKFVVLYLGNHGISQGLGSLLSAADLLRNEKDIFFLFVGDGTEKERLLEIRDKLGLENVAFIPIQPKQEVPKFYAAANVCIVPLRDVKLFSGFVPSKMFEIMGSGRPIIGSVAGEARDILERSGGAVCVASEDPKGLANAIIDLYKDPARCKGMGEQGYHFVKTYYSREVLAEKYIKGVQNIADRRIHFVKRSFDLILSGLGLLGSSPLWALFAGLVKLEDGGPVFYRQERVGKDGRTFFAMKFRSMIPDAEAGLGPVQAAYDDPRVTRVGRLLRATAMDELPQLWNIFIGDMSFVGPRALRPMEIGTKTVRREALGVRGEERKIEEVPNFHLRHRVQPGLTGLAQIYAPRDATRRQKLRYDLLYARSRSFWLDLKLIALSFWITFRGKWEERGKKV